MGRQYVPRSWDPDHVNCTSSGQLCDCCWGGGVAGFPAAASYAYLLLMLCVPLVFFFTILFFPQDYTTVHTHTRTRARASFSSNTHKRGDNNTTLLQRYGNVRRRLLRNVSFRFFFLRFYSSYVKKKKIVK